MKHTCSSSGQFSHVKRGAAGLRRPSRVAGLACSALAVGIFASVAAAAANTVIIYVDDDATPHGDGSSWNSAFDSLSAAILDRTTSVDHPTSWNSVLLRASTPRSLASASTMSASVTR